MATSDRKAYKKAERKAVKHAAEDQRRSHGRLSDKDIDKRVSSLTKRYLKKGKSKA